MRKSTSLLAALALATCAPAWSAQDNWPQWRGPLGTGESKSAKPPVEWSEQKNVRWKVALPGRGNSSPVVWGDHVFVLTAVGFGGKAEPEEAESGEGRGRRGGGQGNLKPDQEQRFTVMALRRKDGSVAWSDVAIEALPKEGTHGDGTWASGSPVTDGSVLLAHFGSQGLYAYDLEGKKLWEAHLGQMRTRNSFGEGSSPALHRGTAIVQWDHEGPSFIVALDAKTGKEKWRKGRDEPTCWATPLVVELDGKAQVITNGTNRIRSYDLESGEILWQVGGMTANAIPSPVYADGLVHLMSGFRGNKLLSIRLAEAKGDLSGRSALAWDIDRDTPYVPSPLLMNGRLYFLKANTGILSVFEAATGKQLYGPERLQAVANVYASPVGAAGRVYLAGRDGEIEVREDGPECKLLATNRLDDRFDASPALVGGEIYLRGAKNLYCIAESGESR
jgi:outer membrane protein assembly factor BamB